jgi:hypothetical protein
MKKNEKNKTKERAILLFSVNAPTKENTKE